VRGRRDQFAKNAYFQRYPLHRENDDRVPKGRNRRGALPNNGHRFFENPSKRTSKRFAFTNNAPNDVREIRNVRGRDVTIPVYIYILFVYHTFRNRVAYETLPSGTRIQNRSERKATARFRYRVTGRANDGGSVPRDVVTVPFRKFRGGSDRRQGRSRRLSNRLPVGRTRKIRYANTVRAGRL